MDSWSNIFAAVCVTAAIVFIVHMIVGYDNTPRLLVYAMLFANIARSLR